MRRFTAAMVITLVAAGTPIASAAGPGSGGALVLVGSRSASISLLLRSAPIVKDPFTVDAVTKGSYAGYVISDTAGHVVAGSVAVHGVGMMPGEGVPIGFAANRLKPGRYVVTLLTDGAARVVIPLARGGRSTVRPTHPVQVFAQIAHNDMLPGTPAGSPLAYSATPVPAGHHQLAAVTQFFTATAAAAGATDQCFTTSSLCEFGGNGGSYSYVFPSVGEASGYSGMSMSPANFQTGTQAVLDSADVAAQALHAGFILVLG